MKARKIDGARATLVGVAALLAAACATPPPPPGPSTAANVATPAAVASCRPTSAAATLVPTRDVIPELETHAIVQQFLDGIARWYDEPGSVDRCRLFTDAGWSSFIAADWRARDVVANELRFRETHVLRLANEIENSPRSAPPRLALDVIFDIQAGATIREASSGTAVSARSDMERTGFAVAFIRDSSGWRADRVSDVSLDSRQWARLPAPIGAPKRCVGFRDDGTRQRVFDEDVMRPWCDGGASGRLVELGQELTMTTRYPCQQGHAAVIALADRPGQAIDPLLRREYVRDPGGDFLASGWITTPYESAATLPPSAYFSGWSNGNIALWIDPATWDQAAYVVRNNVVERWPRAVEQWGVIDCN